MISQVICLILNLAADTLITGTRVDVPIYFSCCQSIIYLYICAVLSGWRRQRQKEAWRHLDCRATYWSKQTWCAMMSVFWIVAMTGHFEIDLLDCRIGLKNHSIPFARSFSVSAPIRLVDRTWLMGRTLCRPGTVPVFTEAERLVEHAFGRPPISSVPLRHVHGHPVAVEVQIMAVSSGEHEPSRDRGRTRHSHLGCLLIPFVAIRSWIVSCFMPQDPHWPRGRNGSLKWRWPRGFRKRRRGIHNFSLRWQRLAERAAPTRAHSKS